MFARRRSSKQNAASPPEPNSEHAAAHLADTQHRLRPHFLSGDVCYLFSDAADAFLHMTNDEVCHSRPHPTRHSAPGRSATHTFAPRLGQHDVGAYWKECNCWHTFVLCHSGPQGVPLRGGDCVWLLGTSGKCVDATPSTDGSPTAAKSAPRVGGSSQQLCLVPLRTDGEHPNPSPSSRSNPSPSLSPSP
eukprot:scaffold28108_cov61-Phaeocystis_antarctica.AAC.4